jgi:hypothetical protein
LLEQELHKITGIPASALRSQKLSEFSVKERRSWVAGRTTTLKEDKVYCLLGIFRVFLVPNYGEGEEYATMRLKEEIQKRQQGQATTVSQDLSSTSFLTSSITSMHYVITLTFSLVDQRGLWIVPVQRNRLFTGLKTELAHLEKLVFAQDHTTKDHTTKIAITGPPNGLDKSQLAIEFLYRAKDKYESHNIVWIPDMTTESIHQAYFEVAMQFGIPGWDDQESDLKNLVHEFLNTDQAGKWLLVFDNADDMCITGSSNEVSTQTIIDCVPNSKQGCLIFVIRDRIRAFKLLSPNVVAVPQRNSDIDEVLLQARSRFEMAKVFCGTDSVSTLNSMFSCATFYKAYGQHTEALKLLEECVQLRQRVLGIDHPDSVSSAATLTEWRASQANTKR